MLWRKIIRFWKSFLVICAITYVCLLREPNISLSTIVCGDKLGHGLMYLLLTLVLLLDSKPIVFSRWKKWIIIVLFSVIYGGIIEILQDKFFYPRTGDWIDWLADCIGALTGIVLWIMGQKWYERRMDK